MANKLKKTRIKEEKLTLIFWRHINIPCLANDLRRDITIIHARVTRNGLRIGSRVRHQKTIMIRHFNCPNILMIKFILVVDEIVHIQQVGNDLVGLIMSERLSLTKWHCAVNIIIHG